MNLNYNFALNKLKPIFNEKSIIQKQILENIAKELSAIKNDNKFISSLTKLLVFGNEKHYIGQFCKMFRAKLIQNIYSPERLFELDPSEMLPEVFLNPKTSDEKKQSLYNDILILLGDEELNCGNELKNFKNPTSRIKQLPLQINYGLEKNIKENQLKDIRDLCSNPYWDTNTSNVIICKSNGKFYCLNVEKLLQQIVKDNVAMNYFTNKPLPNDIQQNLKRRYATEIEQLKKGETISIGSYNEDDISKLKVTLQNLLTLKKHLEVQDVVDEIKEDMIFNYDFLNDNIFNVIPELDKEKLKEINDEDEFMNNLNKWIDENITKIKNIISKDTAKDTGKDTGNDTDESDSEESEVDEKMEIVTEILNKPNTLVNSIYKGYKDKLAQFKNDILNLLIKTNEPNIRNKLQEELSKVIQLNKKFEKQVSSIEGIIKLLEETLETNRKKMIDETKTNVFGEKKGLSIGEKETLKIYIQNIENEIQKLKALQAKI